MEIRGILNKVTPSTYDELSTDFCNYKIYEDQALLPKIIDLIFDKAVEEPHFCALYSDLCKKQVKEESEKAGSSHFRTALITKCQQTFDESRASDLKVEELKKKTQVRGVGEKELKALEEEVERVRHKEKKRLLGIIRFVVFKMPKFLIKKNFPTV
jgi:translation initiation factor 4G